MSSIEDLVKSNPVSSLAVIAAVLYLVGRWVLGFLIGRWVKSQDDFRVDVEARMRLLERDGAKQSKVDDVETRTRLLERDSVTKGDITALWERLDTVDREVKEQIGKARDDSNRQIDRLIVALRNGRQP